MKLLTIFNGISLHPDTISILTSTERDSQHTRDTIAASRSIVELSKDFLRVAISCSSNNLIRKSGIFSRKTEPAAVQCAQGKKIQAKEWHLHSCERQKMEKCTNEGKKEEAKLASQFIGCKLGRYIGFLKSTDKLPARIENDSDSDHQRGFGSAKHFLPIAFAAGFSLILPFEAVTNAVSILARDQFSCWD